MLHKVVDKSGVMELLDMKTLIILIRFVNLKHNNIKLDYP